MTLGQRLTQLRNSKGLSQDALAEAIGVSRQSVSKWETDASIPDLEKLVKLSDFFAVSLDELVKGTPPASSAAPTGASWQHWFQRLISLYRKKAHLLGWLLAAWGADGLLDSFQLIAHYYREMGVDTAFRAASRPVHRLLGQAIFRALPLASPGLDSCRCWRFHRAHIHIAAGGPALSALLWD